MRKLLVIPALAVLAACAGGGNTDKGTDSTAVDSTEIKAKEMEMARQDSIRQDSLLTIKADSLYATALTFNAGKASVKYRPESEIADAVLPVTVTNNTDVVIPGDAYKITYSLTSEVTRGGEFVDVTSTKTENGVEVPARGTATVTIKKTGNAIKFKSGSLTISKEDFAKLLKEAK